MQMMLATATLMVLLCGLGPTMASPRRHIDPQADFTQQQQEDQPQMTFINTDDYQSDDSLALQVYITPRKLTSSVTYLPSLFGVCSFSV